ncbi:glycoside hydrolase family 13 protein [Streptomyces sp. PSKA54]|uniref:Glycoside hydrolase family 13 protein n=1 Tax=Streptomyces himalayensis subsp. aureolus TaxID=2758039 RepID=A0A7W2HID4_9ACTN|nr:glycoside hydrolase family 13 protein [Streptomyces himalayensis]MBA4864947.1 glycoside hydrolase family 13 protein [Streptomyces himalayensis subsp. aureolus]
MSDPNPTSDAWWRSATIYQVYIRSFADGDGDGTGDIAGLRSRLQYLAHLGIDAIWINPWYPSPLADGGYDVSDYRDIHPTYGTLDEAGKLITEAHELGLRVILDIVPNHTSDQHAWFQQALAAGPGSPERDRFIFRDGRGEDGSLPPNDWYAAFGGRTWTRTDDGQWYLHLFAPEQPDLNWDNPEVRAEFESILRFWFDLGVDGFRIDVAHGMVKDPALPDLGLTEFSVLTGEGQQDHPHWDRDGIHDIFRSWRAIADSYPDPRVFVAEAHVRPGRMPEYLRADELHTAFNFDFLKCPLEAGKLREVIDRSITSLGTVGAPATWVLSNHDETRHVTRYGRADTGVQALFRNRPIPSDLALGTRRARAAALLMFALPGGAYIYQGEELGLYEVEDLPEEVLQDPTWERSGHTIRGRDGCRVPLPWTGDTPPFGFSWSGATPWLPQPEDWKSYTAEANQADPTSMLQLYRSALRLRRTNPGLRGEEFRWLDSPEGTLLFERGNSVLCAVNLSDQAIPLPDACGPLLASGPLSKDGLLPPDTTVLLHRE